MVQKIIDGKVYDTDTAIKVESDGLAELYITKKGAWFLFRVDSSSFTALEKNKAFDWLYKNSKADAIKIYFPNSIEDA
jgi:hypothetical protein